MEFSTFENEVAEIREFGAHTLWLTSNTSKIDGVTFQRPTDTDNAELWGSLKSNGYNLLGNTLVTIRRLNANPNILPRFSHKLHAQLTAPSAVWDNNQIYIVIILDEHHNTIVDWALVPTFPSPRFSFRNQPAIQFDIPLVPVDKKPGALVEDPQGVKLLPNWQDGQTLTFGVFSIDFGKPLYFAPALLLHAPFHPALREHWPYFTESVMVSRMISLFPTQVQVQAVSI